MTLVIMYWIDVLELLSEGQPLMFSVMDIEIDICTRAFLETIACTVYIANQDIRSCQTIASGWAHV